MEFVFNPFAQVAFDQVIWIFMNAGVCGWQSVVLELSNCWVLKRDCVSWALWVALGDKWGGFVRLHHGVASGARGWLRSLPLQEKQQTLCQRAVLWRPLVHKTDQV
jgi:hypothetical protein